MNAETENYDHVMAGRDEALSIERRRWAVELAVGALARHDMSSYSVTSLAHALERYLATGELAPKPEWMTKKDA